MKLIKNNGLTLIEFLIMGGLIAFAIVLSLKFFAGHTKGTRVVQMLTDRESLRQQILLNLDCKTTLNPISVCSGGAIPLKRKDGSTFLAAGGNVGPWAVTATCHPSGSPTHLKIVATQTGIKDPVTNLYLDANHPKAQLFLPPSAPTCTALFTTGPACTDCYPGTEVMIGVLPNGCPKCSSARRPIKCINTSNTCTSAQVVYYYYFTAADCGGILPDTTHVGMLGSTEAPWRDANWAVIQSTETNGSGVVWRKWGSGSDCNAYGISAVFIKR